MDLSKALQKASQRYLDLVAGNFQRHDISVTGATLDSFRDEQKQSSQGFRILAAQHAEAVEYGRGPTLSGSGGGQVIRRITQWIADRGLDLNPYAVSKTIHIKGTRLWRGEDTRYPGRTQSGVLTEPIQIMKDELLIDLKTVLASDLEKKIKLLFT